MTEFQIEGVCVRAYEKVYITMNFLQPINLGGNS